MSSLNIVSEILNEDFLVSGDKLIEENKDHLGVSFRMEVPIISEKSIAYKLYKFDQAGKTIFPYFKSGHGLRKVCDYILFAEAEAIMYVFPIELKKGTRHSAGKQLKASKAFVNYILDSAKRIGHGLDIDKIYIRTIRICAEGRKTTKEEAIRYIDEHVDYQCQKFRLKMLMHY